MCDLPNQRKASKTSKTFFSEAVINFAGMFDNIFAGVEASLNEKFDKISQTIENQTREIQRLTLLIKGLTLTGEKKENFPSEEAAMNFTEEVAEEAAIYFIKDVAEEATEDINAANKKVSKENIIKNNTRSISSVKTKKI